MTSIPFLARKAEAPVARMPVPQETRSGVFASISAMRGSNRVWAIFFVSRKWASANSVALRLRDGRDFQSLLRGDLLVALDIAFGIDDDSFTAALATDQVGILREIRIRDLSKKHTAR